MEKILEVKNLTKQFQIGKGLELKAVDDISFDIYEGETLGLVGESGCGKSTLGRTIIRLYQATSGNVVYKGKDVHMLSNNDKKDFHKNMQMIFQDPYASLNPRMTVADIIAEGLDIHRIKKGEARKEEVYQLLETVGLKREHANRYAHEFSGGQRQRIGIARALAVRPQFIIADEPISALDVSVQAQIVNLLMELQKKKKLTYIFISHDLSMVRLISNRIGVMYLGNMMELAPSNNLYENPLHPYTSSLLKAIPIPDPNIEESKDQMTISGDLPNPTDPPSGCVYRTRCPYVTEECYREKPILKQVDDQHFVACHLVGMKLLENSVLTK